jgi:hypothetical protein
MHIPNTLAHAPIIVANDLSFSANQIDVTFVGALYMHGYDSAQIVCPAKTYRKLVLIKHRTHKPIEVPQIPTIKPNLKPYLSRA